VVRAKAFTLLACVYDDVRAGVLCVRRKHGDGDEIMRVEQQLGATTRSND
jgi:hypothetical protein